MKHYYVFLCINIISVITMRGMQEQASLTSLPDFVLCNILRYISTERILKFREVNKQAQKVAEIFLSNNHKKQITIHRASFTPIALIKKLSGITLQFDRQHNKIFIDIASSLINQASHIKALHLDFSDNVTPIERRSLKVLFTQLQHLEVLKVQQQPPLTKLNSVYHYDDYDIGDVLKALPVYTNLKKLYVNTQMRAYWSIFLKILPFLKKLEVLRIKGSPPYDTKQFLVFTQALQNLMLLRKLGIHTITLNKHETDALIRSLSTLKNLRILNLSKSIMASKDLQKIKKLLPALQISKSHEPIDLNPALFQYLL